MEDLINHAGEIILKYKNPGKKLKLVNLKSPGAVAEFARKVWPSDLSIRERMLVILVNNQLNAAAHFWLGTGGSGSTPVDLKLLNFIAVQFMAYGVILVHNHPAMNTKPSAKDIETTTEAIAGLNLIKIELIDHLIITPYDCLSIREDHNPALFENQFK